MRKIFIVLACIGFLVFLGSSAGATVISFADTNNYAPTWANGTLDDTRDVIGTPQIVGGSIAVTNGTLDSISFDYNSYSSLYSAGDLFIDLGQNDTWDYVADASSGKLYHIISTFSAVKGVNDNYYLTSDYFKAIAGASWGDYRDGHAVAMNVDAEGLAYEVLGDFDMVGFNSDTTTDVLFAGLGIDLGGQSFTFQFAPTCANDVVYNKVPEPGTALFLSAAFMGFGIMGRRRYLNS